MFTLENPIQTMIDATNHGDSQVPRQHPLH
jgi:hypothetical protein